MTVSAPQGVRCAAWARAEDLDPIGTAGSYQGFLLVELPPPWPRDVGEASALAGIRPALESRRIRLQAIGSGATPGRRLISYLNPHGRDFAGYGRAEADFGDDLASAAGRIVSAPHQPWSAAGTGAKDLLVCTHGRRDVCCGSLGTELAMSLATATTPDGVRLWRTSHTGGHRFAPTFVVLPEGTMWAYADVGLIQRIVSRTGDVADVVDRYRGCAGLPSPQVQALEREVLRRTGWDLLDRPRWGEVGGDGQTRLFVEQPGGDTATWAAVVTPGREMPVPDCGRPISESKKSETEWLVSELLGGGH